MGFMATIGLITMLSSTGIGAVPEGFKGDGQSKLVVLK